MTTQELRQQIEKVLGNSIRCLLPSYWWKKLFGLVIDEVDSVRTITDDKANISSVQALSQNVTTLSSRLQSLSNLIKSPDMELSLDSKNAVENKVITKELVSRGCVQLVFVTSMCAEDEVDICIESNKTAYERMRTAMLFESWAVVALVGNDLREDGTASGLSFISSSVRILSNILGLLISIIHEGQKKYFVLKSDGTCVPYSSKSLISLDDGLSLESTQPVQNKVVTAALESKVNKVEGKQLSTEDFTSLLKAKLEGLSNYDDTAIQGAINSLTTQINTLVSGDASVAIESFNEIIAFLNGIEDSENLDSIIASIEQQIANVQNAIPTKTSQLNNDSGFIAQTKTINGESIVGEGNIVVKADVDTSNLATKEELNAKQDVISDLATIRSGAEKGATALQEHQDISHLATKEEVNNLINEVIDDEEVLAHSLNELNDRVNNMSEELSGDFASKEDLIPLEEADSANQQAIEAVEGSVTTLSERVDNIATELTEDFATKEELQTSNETLTNDVIDDEEVLAYAINDLNDRVNELAENVSGEAATKVELAEAVSTINETINTNDERYDGEFSALDNRIDELAANVSGETVTKVEFEETITNLTNDVIDDEEVLAHAINDLKSMIDTLIARVDALESNNA